MLFSQRMHRTLPTVRSDSNAQRTPPVRSYLVNIQGWIQEADENTTEYNQRPEAERYAGHQFPARRLLRHGRLSVDRVIKYDGADEEEHLQIEGIIQVVHV